MSPKSKMNTTPVSCNDCNSLHSSLFCKLDSTELGEISINKTINSYQKGQLIFQESHRPQGLYCIYTGKVKIYKLGDEGRDQIVRLAGKGDILGYRSLLSGEPYSASATALEDTEVCHIPKETFFDLLKQNSELAIGVIKTLTEDLKQAELRLTNISQKHVRERIAETLLMLKESYGFEKDNMTINAILGRTDIGSIAGTTTETTIRMLSDLNKEGLIKLFGKKIQILNLAKLLQVANIAD